MKVAFVCVNYNRSKLTEKYILNVLRIKGDNDVKIFIVDNASSETEIFWLTHFVERLANDQIVLVRSPVNEGYFKGLNIGIELALAQGYHQFQIIGNNDLEFQDDFLTVLTNMTLEQDELVIAPCVITKGRIFENPHVIKPMSFLRKLKLAIFYSHVYVAKFILLFFSLKRKPKPFNPKRQHIYMGIGALYILTPQFFKHFNQLWAEVFLYGEEAVFAGQIRSVKGKILYEPLLRCKHNESATTSHLRTNFRFKLMQKSYRIYKKYL